MMSQAVTSPRNYSNAALQIATRLKDYTLIGAIPPAAKACNPWETHPDVNFLFLKDSRYYLCSAAQLLKNEGVSIALAEGGYIYVKSKPNDQDHYFFRLKKHMHLRGHALLMNGFSNHSVMAAGEIFCSQGRLILYNNKSSNFPYSIAVTQREINNVFRSETAQCFFKEIESDAKITDECQQRRRQLAKYRLDEIKMTCQFILTKPLIETVASHFLNQIDLVIQSYSMQGDYLASEEKIEIKKLLQQLKLNIEAIYHCRSSRELRDQIHQFNILLNNTSASTPRLIKDHKVLQNMAMRLKKQFNFSRIEDKFKELDATLDAFLESKKLTYSVFRAERGEGKYALIANLSEKDLCLLCCEYSQQVAAKSLNYPILIREKLISSNVKLPMLHVFHSPTVVGKSSDLAGKPSFGVCDDIAPHMGRNRWFN
jgi:hypothetical protein